MNKRESEAVRDVHSRVVKMFDDDTAFISSPKGKTRAELVAEALSRRDMCQAILTVLTPMVKETT